MFESLGHLLVRRRKAALALFIIGIILSGVFGSLIFSRLDAGGYSDPKSDSYKVYEYLRDDLKINDPSVVLGVDAGNRDITSPDVVQEAKSLEAKIAQEEGITKTLSYWSSGGEATLKSKDGRAGYILIYGESDAFSPESHPRNNHPSNRRIVHRSVNRAKH